MGFERISFDHLRSEGTFVLKSAGWFAERVFICVGSRGEGRWQTHGQARIDLIHFGLRREGGRGLGGGKMVLDQPMSQRRLMNVGREVYGAGKWVLEGGSDQGVRLLGPWGSGGSGGAFCGRVPVGGLFEDSGGVEFSYRCCSREESNLHEFPHTVLSRTRLPFRHVSFALIKIDF